MRKLTSNHLVEMITLDLKKSNNQDIIQGKLILNISTNVNVPIRNGVNNLTSSSRNSVASSTTAVPAIQTVAHLPPQPPQQQNLQEQQPPPHSTVPSSSTAADEGANSRNHGLPEG